MNDGPLPESGEELAVEVKITPATYRRRAIIWIGLGLATIALAVVATVVFGRTVVQPFFTAAFFGYGIYCAVQARRQTTCTVLWIDRFGARSPEGLHDFTWDGVTMVWVGSSTGLRLPFTSQAVLSVYTQAGIDLAQRAGVRPQPRHKVAVGRWNVADLCERLSRMTNASIIDGTRVSRRAAAAALLTTAV